MENTGPSLDPPARFGAHCPRIFLEKQLRARPFLPVLSCGTRPGRIRGRFFPVALEPLRPQPPPRRWRRRALSDPPGGRA
eukprot:gene13841-biopygen5058